jgi:phosphorylcholine metabolism protein LicD
MDLFGKTPRPVFNEEMLSELAKQVGKQVFEWCNGDTSLERCVSDSLGIVKHVDRDGYQIAKDFERIGYCPDSELVEILEGVDSLRYNILSNAIKKWVVSDEIVPEIKIGASVIVLFGRKKVEGIVTGYHEEVAMYKVCIPSQGMTIKSSNRALINYENAELSESLGG